MVFFQMLSPHNKCFKSTDENNLRAQEEKQRDYYQRDQVPNNIKVAEVPMQVKFKNSCELINKFNIYRVASLTKLLR